MTSAEKWGPVRYVARPQRCDFCWRTIPAGKPGTRTGDRGTRAWYSETRRVWECLECRTEGFRAEEARAEADARAKA